MCIQIEEKLKAICDYGAAGQRDKCLKKPNLYKLLHPYRYFLSFYLTGEGKTLIGGELYIIYKNGKALLDFKDSYFEKLDLVSKEIVIKPIHITGDINHAALLILDLKNNTFEYFDPEGYPSWYKDILVSIKSFIKYFAPKLKYSPPRCFGIQKFSEGVCADWSLLYLYLKSTCPDVTIVEITKSIINASQTLESLIQKWECYLWDIVDNNNFYEILIGDVLLKNRSTNYTDIMNNVYILLSKRDVNQARTLIKNELNIGDEYFNKLVLELPRA